MEYLEDLKLRLVRYRENLNKEETKTLIEIKKRIKSNEFNSERAGVKIWMNETIIEILNKRALCQ